MIVGAAVVEIHVHESHSLKQKRGVVRSISQRVRNRFNLAVSEVGGQGTWQRAVLGLAASGIEARRVRSVLESAILFIEELQLAEVRNSDIEIIALPYEADSVDAEGDWAETPWDESNGGADGSGPLAGGSGGSGESGDVDDSAD